MIAPNVTTNLPKVNIDSTKNKRLILLYLVFGISAIAIIMLVAMIIWLATKDNKPYQPENPNISLTPSPTSDVGTTVIPDIPIVESTKFIYIERVDGKETGNIVSYDLKTEQKENITTGENIESIISISPNNKYLFLQTKSNLDKDEYCVFDIENKGCELLNITNVIQTFWSSNDFINFLYKKSDDEFFYIDSYNARERTQTKVLTFDQNLVNNPLVSRDLKYLVGINKSDDSYHIINLAQKTNQTISSLNLISGSIFSPLLWNTDGRLVYSSSTGIFRLNPVLLSSTQLVNLTTSQDKLDISFLNYNEDQKSLLFMLDGYIYRFNINTEILKEVYNMNSRTNFKLVDLKGNGQNFFVMENYDGMMEAYNIINSKLATICTKMCKNPIWFY